MKADAWFAGGERVSIELGDERFEIFYRIDGAGPWLTALHGFPTCSWDWAKVVPDLERRFRVLCFDFLGFGDSDKPRTHRYSIFEQADLTEALWRALGVEQTMVVAHDYGATVAQELLARSETSTRVTSVTVLNAAVYMRLARPLLIQRLLAGRLTGPIVARAVTERTFRRSFESIFSAEHPIAEAEIQAVPDFGAQVDVGFVSGLGRVGERLLVLLDVGKLLGGDVRVGEGPPVTVSLP